MAASYGAPGVYVEEKPSGSMPVQGVGTAVAAFVGFTELYRPDAGDPTDPDGVKPQLVTSWPQYERVYGGFAPGIKLPHTVKGFFENGGGICYIVRIPTEGGNGRLPQRALPAAGRHEIETLVVESRHADARLDVVIEGAPPVEGQEQASPEFTLKVVQDGAVKEEYGGLTIGRGQRGVDRVVNERSKLIQVQVQTVTGLSLADRVPAPGRYSIVPAAPATISAWPSPTTSPWSRSPIWSPWPPTRTGRSTTRCTLRRRASWSTGARRAVPAWPSSTHRPASTPRARWTGATRSARTAPSAPTASGSGAPAPWPAPTRAGGTSTSGACSSSSRSRSAAARSGSSSSRTTRTCGPGSAARCPRS